MGLSCASHSALTVHSSQTRFVLCFQAFNASGEFRRAGLVPAISEEANCQYCVGKVERSGTHRK